MQQVGKEDEKMERRNQMTDHGEKIRSTAPYSPRISQNHRITEWFGLKGTLKII